MHRGQPRGNLADAVKTVVLYAYATQRTRETGSRVRKYTGRKREKKERHKYGIGEYAATRSV